MNVTWAEPALSDVESIRDFIKRDSEYYATRFVDRIIEVVESLGSLSERGRRVPETEDENVRDGHLLPISHHLSA